MIKPVSKSDEATFVRGFKTRCENIALQYRHHLDIVAAAPLLAFQLAEYLGVLIWGLENIPGLPLDALRHLKSVEGDEWSAVAVRVASQDIIVLNPRHSPARQSNDLMHELAHLILNHEPCTVIVSDTAGVGIRSFDKRQEAEADWLAACLLLPRPAVAFCHSQNMTADVAADHFSVSRELYTYRLRMTGVEKQHFNRVVKRERSSTAG